LAKAFDTSCPVAKFVEKSQIADPHQLELVCSVNGQIRQREKTDKVKSS
jgi:2-keto-4-pentenoate hydratase/2-oxohepta-3-ene-1,7-dioic acid hydratase in catechol pathway